jgi:hypothetical protein
MWFVQSFIKGCLVVVFHNDARSVRIVSSAGKGLDEGRTAEELLKIWDL